MQRIEEYSRRGRQSLRELAAAEIDTLLGIEERFKQEFGAAVDSYKPSASANAGVEVPQIARLEPECHNFLYEAKNFIRVLLQVVNHLYGTTFEEASEFSRAAKKKGGQSLVEFAEKTFGPGDGKTKMLKEAVPTVEALISMRNAVEHPDGYSGKLVITNFELELGADGKHLDEPGWHREKDGKAVDKPTAIRADMETCIHNLLTLGEDVFVSWASDHLEVPDLMRVACIPEERRNPDRPVKWTVTLNQRLQHSLSAGALGLFRHGESAVCLGEPPGRFDFNFWERPLHTEEEKTDCSLV